MISKLGSKFTNYVDDVSDVAKNIVDLYKDKKFMLTLGTPGAIVGSIIGASTGGVRGTRLSDAERRKLEKEHDLPENANLATRNTGRGALGGLVGGAIGVSSTPVLMGLPYLIPKLRHRYADFLARMSSDIGFGLFTGIASASALAGSALGSKMSTDKYSKGYAK